MSPRVSRQLVVLAVLASLAGPGHPARAGSGPPPAASPAAFAPRVTPTPMVAELLRAVAEGREQVAALRAEIAATRDAARVLDLQRRIEETKRETELTLLRVQIGHARREGRGEVAVRLERALDAMLAPPGSAAARAPGSTPAPRAPR